MYHSEIACSLFLLETIVLDVVEWPSNVAQLVIESMWLVGSH